MIIRVSCWTLPSTSIYTSYILIRADLIELEGNFILRFTYLKLISLSIWNTYLMEFSSEMLTYEQIFHRLELMSSYCLIWFDLEEMLMLYQNTINASLWFPSISRQSDNNVDVLNVWRGAQARVWCTPSSLSQVWLVIITSARFSLTNLNTRLFLGLSSFWWKVFDCNDDILLYLYFKCKK